MQSVDLPLAGPDAVLGVVLLDAPLGLVDVVAQQIDLPVAGQHLGRANRTLVMSIETERLTRRPPDCCMPRQFWNESLTSRYGGSVTIVLSKLRILTVVSDTSSTVPSAPYLGMEIQSPT